MKDYFSTLQQIVNSTAVIIDRPKGSAHPRYPDYIYELDYGYLDGTASADGDGIDVWLGSGNQKTIAGILIIVDPVKKDSEIKILLGCNDEEIEKALKMNNRGEMKAMVVRNEEAK